MGESKVKVRISARWRHGEVFPIIKEAIGSLSTEKRRWVRHDEIVASLMHDPSIVSIVGHAPDRNELSTMVAWFSEKLTEFEEEKLSENYGEVILVRDAYILFERKKLEGRYAYRLRTAAIPLPPTLKERIEELRMRQEVAKEIEKLKQRLREGVLTPEEFRNEVAKLTQP